MRFLTADEVRHLADTIDPRYRAFVLVAGYGGFRLGALLALRMHDLRHTAISLWIAARANPKQIAVRAGHTSVSVVLDRYGHLLPQHEDALLQAPEYPPSSAASK